MVEIGSNMGGRQCDISAGDGWRVTLSEQSSAIDENVIQRETITKGQQWQQACHV
jgi:hypothetical protein